MRHLTYCHSNGHYQPIGFITDMAITSDNVHCVNLGIHNIGRVK